MSDDSPPDSIDQSKEKKKSRRPANTAFRQQRLKAWQPILTPKTVIPLFFAIGIICAPIGGLLIWASTGVKYFSIEYTNCAQAAPTDAPGPVDPDLIKTAWGDNNTVTATWQRFDNISYTYGNYEVQNLTSCVLNFTTPKALEAPVLFYYSLENFYQNHRRYVQSFYADQLVGKEVSRLGVSDSLCDPLYFDDKDRIYYPCGLIANSMFNDTFEDLVLLNVPTESTVEERASDNQTYVLSSTGIAWESDKELYKKTEVTDYSTIAPPLYWRKRFPNDSYSEEYPPPDIGADEHFMVWMRTAGLPDFSKLYGRNDTNDLVAGTYSLTIIDNFRVDAFAGKKRVLFTELSPMGGHNNFLGILWLVVGGFCVVLAVVFLITNFIKPRKLGDHTYLSWNNAPASAAAKGKGKAAGGPGTGAAMASGRDI